MNTLLLYIPLLALTDGMTDRESHTLASRGLEELFFEAGVVSQMRTLAIPATGSHVTGNASSHSPVDCCV